MSDREVIRVRDVMKQKFDIVDGMESVQSALEKMRHIETKCVLVDKRHPDDEFGMLLLDRRSTRLNSSHLGISYAVFCLKKKKKRGK